MYLFNIPHDFKKAEYIDMRFFNDNTAAPCKEYSRGIPFRTLPDSRVFSGIFNKMWETSVVPNSDTTFKCANEQNANEVEIIIDLVDFLQASVIRMVN